MGSTPINQAYIYWSKLNNTTQQSRNLTGILKDSSPFMVDDGNEAKASSISKLFLGASTPALFSKNPCLNFSSFAYRHDASLLRF